MVVRCAQSSGEWPGVRITFLRVLAVEFGVGRVDVPGARGADLVEGLRGDGPRRAEVRLVCWVEV